MKIVRVYNNNIIAASNNDHEVILTGIGIGFRKKPGDDVDQAKIDKTYTFENKQRAQFNHILQHTPLLYFRIAEAIAERATETLNITLSNQILISLTDHLCYAVERKKKNLMIPNLMLSEIKTLYKDEYKIGLWALKLIEVNTKISLGEHEASFIAMHIVNATLGDSSRNATKIIRFVRDIQTVIEDHFDVEFDENDLDLTRLQTHLKFLAQHILLKNEKQFDDPGELYEFLIKNHHKMLACIQSISKTIKENYNYTLEKYEEVYLMIHVRKVIK